MYLSCDSCPEYIQVFVSSDKSGRKIVTDNLSGSYTLIQLPIQVGRHSDSRSKFMVEVDKIIAKFKTSCFRLHSGSYQSLQLQRIHLANGCWYLNGEDYDDRITVSNPENIFTDKYHIDAINWINRMPPSFYSSFYSFLDCVMLLYDNTSDVSTA